MANACYVQVLMSQPPSSIGTDRYLNLNGKNRRVQKKLHCKENNVFN